MDTNFQMNFLKIKVIPSFYLMLLMTFFQELIIYMNDYHMPGRCRWSCNSYLMAWKTTLRPPWTQ